MTTCGTPLVSLPGAQLVQPSNAQLLGSPLGDDASISAALADKVEALRRLSERLKLLSAHDALILLRNCFALPKLLYVLLTVTNTHLQPGLSAWTQATLPVTLGGLGIHSTVEVAPSAFLSSVHSSSELVKAILPPSFSSFPRPLTVEAQTSGLWVMTTSHLRVPLPASRRLWVRAASVAERLLECAEN